MLRLGAASLGELLGREVSACTASRFRTAPLRSSSAHESTPPYPAPCSPQDIRLADRGLVWNTDLIEAVELENLLANAAITMHSAEKRK